MRSVARWCFQHRFLVLGAWIVVLFAAFFGVSSTGSNYAAGTQLSGTPSAQAAALLQRAAPSVAGDTETIVFQTKTGHVTDPAVRSQIQQMLTNVSHLQYVGSITSPYTAAGARQVSAAGTIAFAQVNFTKDSSAIPAAEATQLVNAGPGAQFAAPAGRCGRQRRRLDEPVKQQRHLHRHRRRAHRAAHRVRCRASGPAPADQHRNRAVRRAVRRRHAVQLHRMASFTSQLCTLIGLGVGIDYSLFILTRVRSGIRRGLSVQDAVVAAAGTAGRAVMFAGITVCVALLGMVTVGVSVLSGAAIAASVAVLFPMMAAQTLLPALVRIVGTADPDPSAARRARPG